MFNCQLEYSSSAHCSQLYAGFELLRKAGLVKLSLLPGKAKQHNRVRMILNNQHIVVYDVLDGLNWIDASLHDNLHYFRKNIKADFYFKRSFHKSLSEYAPSGCKVFPLGLNYFIKTRNWPHQNWKGSLKSFLKNNRYISRIFSLNRDAFYTGDFEFIPFQWKTNKVLFMTRLYDPYDVADGDQKKLREQINAMRADSIRACKKEFGKLFTGGLYEDHFSVKYAKDLVLPAHHFEKQQFLQEVKESNVCVATTGLHHSIGWKFAEYIAASRAVVSEPLHYDVPGDLCEPHNYYSFRNVTELLERIDMLITNKDILQNMMNNNFRYYHLYIRPDMLILNTLLTISQNL